MRVAFLVDEFPSLAETFMLGQITGLIDRGHEIRIFAKAAESVHEMHPDVERYGLLERTKYIRIPANRLERVLGAVALIYTNLKLKPRTTLRSLNAFKYGRRALSPTLLYTADLFHDKYDILHCQYGPNGNLGAELKRLGIAKKVVTSFHGYDIRLGIELGGKIYRTLSEQGDCFLVISGYNFRNLVSFGFDQEKMIYHPVGIDVRRFSGNGKSGLSGDGRPVRVLTVSRLSAEKGLECGIRAVHRVLNARPEYKLQYDIIGSGPLKEELDQLINQLGLNELVRVVGPKNQSEVIEALYRSDIFLLPSLAEATPKVLMEAQAAGLPVVATATGSTDEVVLDGKSGFLVPSGNADALAERLDYLIQHPQEWNAMGRAGRKHVEENFDIHQLNDRLVRIYQGLLDGRPPNSIEGDLLPHRRPVALLFKT